MATSAARSGQMEALIRALEEAKAGYAPEHNDLIRTPFYLGIMHGMQHAIDIARRAAINLPPAGRGDG